MRSHRDVLGGPLADAGKIAQMRDSLIEIAARIEEPRVGTLGDAFATPAIAASVAASALDLVIPNQ